MAKKSSVKVRLVPEKNLIAHFLLCKKTKGKSKS